MASDSSESPLILTPESTGTAQHNGSPDSPSAAAVKKARRQTAFYPNMNSSNKPQKPFSRSAAKRESVMALGSIEHLQYFFTKTGLAAKKKPLDKARLGLVPAIGGKGHVPATPSITSLTDVPIPSPAVPIPPPPLFSPHIKTYEVDSESLLPGVIDDLILVAQLWNLERTKRDESSPDFSIPFDVLDVLKSTTRAIRSTRNYLLSLPDESTDSLRSKVQFQPKNLGPRSRESSSTSTTATASSHGQTAASDPIARIRRSSLEVLTVLRQVEENYRLPLDDEAYDAQSDVAQSRAFNGSIDLPQDDETATSRSDFDPDISVSFSLVQVQGQYKSVPVWEDDDDDTSLERDEAKEKKDGWEERLVLGTGWLYRSDVKLADLQHERSVVASYLDIVDEVLFNGKPASTVSATDERGWERVRKSREGKASYRLAKNRRVSAGDGEARGIGLGLAVHAGDFGKRRISTGMVDLVERMHLTEEPEDFEDTREDEGVDEASSDDNLPEWAKRSTFPGDNIGRSHTLLANFLPSSLLPALGPPNSRTEFLLSLSSGQLLCVAYNACVRKSKKPWGFISKDSIHNIISLEKAALINGDEDGSKKVWTFRRTDNLRLWIGALKLRYMLPIQMFANEPNSAAVSPAVSPSSRTFSQGSKARECPISFNLKVVAKREEGWEDMLENVLFRWMEKVVDERRAH